MPEIAWKRFVQYATEEIARFVALGIAVALCLIVELYLNTHDPITLTFARLFDAGALIHFARFQYGS
jgi:hypothetical protein